MRAPAAAISAVTGYPLVLGARKAANGVGDYRLNLSQAQYSVTASVPGYYSKTVQHVLINPGNPLRVDMALEPCLKVYLPSLFKR